MYLEPCQSPVFINDKLSSIAIKIEGLLELNNG
jgi:hypothetical protein